MGVWTCPVKRLLCVVICYHIAPGGLGSGRGLMGNLREGGVDTGVFRSRGGPDGGAGASEAGVVQSAGADHDQMGASFGTAGDWRAAGGAECAVHQSAACRWAGEGLERTVNGERRIVKDQVHGGAAGGQILAIAAPAGPSGDRGFAGLITHRTAQTATFDEHGRVSSGFGHGYAQCGVILSFFELAVQQADGGRRMHPRLVAARGILGPWWSFLAIFGCLQGWRWCGNHQLWCLIGLAGPVGWEPMTRGGRIAWASGGRKSRKRAPP